MRLVLAAILLTTALAGCTEGHEDLTADSYDLAFASVPDSVMAGQSITLELDVQGVQHSSDHIGAHFWSTAPTDPDAQIGDSTGCAHTAGTVPMKVSVTCTFAPGSYFLRGHLRITEGDDVQNWWTDNHKIVATVSEDAYALVAQGTPDRSEGPFQFTLDIRDGPVTTSTHIGAHYWSQPTQTPTQSIGDSVGCAHQEGEVPGVYTVECSPEPGSYQVRGHMRLTIDGNNVDYWTEPFTVTVS